ncbi:GNAT family N-acetyltransferase [Massilia arenosa]|uniref:GNAT family N-acetyltransferase n=2 Tax=Zemynaea arenosa TaxID=2561931 RepID=A0A4Y9S4F1_9BURK|nr:GNAT family N-acetyltransferase [Massilia arenosa]
MTVRPAQRDDLPAVVALLKDCRLPHEDIGPGHLTDFLVAEDTHGLAGTVGLERLGANALVRSLAVRTGLRASGLGKRLVAAIENHGRTHGVDALYLLTTTAADFFKHLGYQTVTRNSAPQALQATTEFSSLCPAQAACMVKRLD